MAQHRVALVFGAAAFMGLVSAHGQAPPFPPVAFDVVSIRPSAKDGGNAIYVNLLPSGIYTTRNMTVDGLIKEAYGFGLRIIDLPDWAGTERYDISAKTDIMKPAMQRRELVKSLLADRFKFAAHLETRDLPVYLLTLVRPDGRLGPRIRPAQGCDPKAERPGLQSDQLPTCGMMFNSTRQNVGNTRLFALIQNLPRSSVDRPVLDRTNLTGNFDWDLQWENDPTGASAGVSIFSALQEQLGLKLEPGRGPVEVLVIDRVEQPTLDN
jgi:uncharacterized protein (TIGR03435 family)